MIHFALLVHIISLATGCAAFSIAGYFFFKSKKSVTLFYLLFLLSLICISCDFTITHYLTILGIQDMKAGQNVISLIGYILCIITIPPFAHYLIGVKYTNQKKIFFSMISGLAIFSTVLLLILQHYLLIRFVLTSIMLGIISYAILFIIFSRHKIGNRHLQRSLRPFFITISIYLPILVLDTFWGELPFLPYKMALPLFFLAFNDVGIFFIFSYLKQPVYVKNREVTEYFIHSFGITNRECEIIQSLATGKSNNEISEELFISVRTVENHLSKIYSKTGAKNRVQLLTLLQSNSN